ncbi:MAG: folylpolyglutamate synthase/dihydrofolate synthase family protein [Bacteroidota bacterium]
MTYEATLAWLFAQLPMYQNKGSLAYKGKLDNIKALTAYLGHPERNFKSLHVAGTNGKGSSCHMLASILQEAGYRTGLYTSPHLKDFRERIKINGELISREAVVTFVAKHRPFFEEHQCSFFEMTVGLAFEHFSQSEVDIAVVEVGLGGRLDATNVITPEVSLITNIGHDHMGTLGDTLAKIAREKAGIIKETVPVVISERQLETEPVFKEVAAQQKSPITFAEDLKLPAYKTDLLGWYQQKNIQGVLACLAKLDGFHINKDQVHSGLLNIAANTGLLGRWQVLQAQPKVVADTAHNEEGLQQVIAQLTEESYGVLHLVLGFVADKEVARLLKLFPRGAQYYFVQPQIARALAVEDLQRLAKAQQLLGSGHRSVAAGLSAALSAAAPDDLVFVGGSTFVVAEVL